MSASVLIGDRDAKWSAAVRELLKEAGIEWCKLRIRPRTRMRMPESFLRSIKEGCLDRIIPLGKRHLRRAVHEYVVHYHRERNHQSLGNAFIDGVEARSVGVIRRRPRLGGLLYCYDRVA
jgi:hypothetical protein